MICKFCGKNLYETISFSNLFQVRYQIHEECEKRIDAKKEMDVIPVENSVVMYDSLASVGYKETDIDFLFTTYMGEWFLKIKDLHNWSIIIFFDDYIDTKDIVLVLSMANKGLILFTILGKTQ